MSVNVQKTSAPFAVPRRPSPTWVVWLRRERQRLLVPVVMVLGVALWAGLVRWQDYPPFILPGPGLVWQKFLIVLADGTLARHAWVTLAEVER